MAVATAAGRERAVRARRRAAGTTVLGVVLVALLVGTVVTVLETFSGAFTQYVPVDAVVAGNGNAVQKGSQVIYRDLPVGVVAGDGRVHAGGVEVPLHIIPDRAGSIPADVTATVEPVTVFGTEYLVLQAPAHPAGRLTAGDVVPAAAPVTGANVQGAVSSLDSILRALHPAELDTALTAIATALRGQGRGIGRTLVSIDHYLATMLPHLPLLEADLGLLAPVADQVAASAPQLVGSLSNLAVAARTITANAGVMSTALTGGAAVAGQLYALLAPTERPLEQILAAAGPFLSDLSQSPTEVAQIVTGLQRWATSWSAAESSGPYLSFSTSVPIANATDLVFAALGAPGTAGPSGLAARALGPSHVDPATYRSRAVPITASSVRVQPAVLTAAEVRAIGALATGLRHGHPPASADVAAVYLGPLLSGLVQS